VFRRTANLSTIEDSPRGSGEDKAGFSLSRLRALSIKYCAIAQTQKNSRGYLRISNRLLRSSAINAHAKTLFFPRRQMQNIYLSIFEQQQRAARSLSASDFVFKVGNTASPANWTTSSSQPIRSRSIELGHPSDAFSNTNHTLLAVAFAFGTCLSSWREIAFFGSEVRLDGVAAQNRQGKYCQLQT
jgi:hypothetical protein